MTPPPTAPVYPPPRAAFPPAPPAYPATRPVYPPPAQTTAVRPPAQTAPPLYPPPAPPQPARPAGLPAAPTHLVNRPMPPVYPPSASGSAPLPGAPATIGAFPGAQPARPAFPPPVGQPVAPAYGTTPTTYPTAQPAPAWHYRATTSAQPLYPPPAGQPVYRPTQPGYGGYAPNPYPYPQPYQPASPGYSGYPSTWATPVYPPVWAPPKRPASGRTAVIVVLMVLLVVSPIMAALIRSLTAPPQPTTPPASQITINPNPTGPTTTPGSTVYTSGTPDLNPDHPPMPSPTQIDNLLDNNPFYSQQTVPTQCDIGTIDLANAPNSQLQDYLNKFVNCLMAVWYPTVVNAGYELPHPSVTVYSHQIHSPCGTLDTGNAVYCSADQQIYYASDLIEYLPPSFANTRFTGEAIIAHEFGHALQYRTMILASEGRKEETSATNAEQMEWSRRTELQADCFAGVFFNAISASAGLTSQDESNIKTLFEALGGTVPNSDDHGTGTSRGYWVSVGLSSSSPGACATYTAPADEVS